jgi:hypothetical protein
LKLLSSKNPNNEIAAEVAFAADSHLPYDPCKAFDLDASFWYETPPCDSDFVADNKNGYCYKILLQKLSRDDGEQYCNYNYDAEMILFDNSYQAAGFVDLFKSGSNAFFS